MGICQIGWLGSTRNLYGPVKSHIQTLFVIALNRGSLLIQYVLDSRLRGNDECGRFFEIIKL